MPKTVGELPAAARRPAPAPSPAASMMQIVRPRTEGDRRGGRQVIGLGTLASGLAIAGGVLLTRGATPAPPPIALVPDARAATPPPPPLPATLIIETVPV